MSSSPDLPDLALPTSIDDTLARLAALDYVADRQLATCVYLALKLQRPLFLEANPAPARPRSRAPWPPCWVGR